MDGLEVQEALPNAYEPQEDELRQRSSMLQMVCSAAWMLYKNFKSNFHLMHVYM